MQRSLKVAIPLPRACCVENNSSLQQQHSGATIISVASCQDVASAAIRELAAATILSSRPPRSIRFESVEILAVHVLPAATTIRTTNSVVVISRGSVVICPPSSVVEDDAFDCVTSWSPHSHFGNNNHSDAQPMDASCVQVMLEIQCILEEEEGAAPSWSTSAFPASVTVPIPLAAPPAATTVSCPVFWSQPKPVSLHSSASPSSVVSISTSSSSGSITAAMLLSQKERDAALIRHARVLVIGAGGIGCEVLKCLVLYGFQHLFVIDLDTIDGTNLNRQFLFRQKDVGQPKSTTAVAAVSEWRTLPSTLSTSVSVDADRTQNNQAMMKGVLANIKDSSFDVEFYRQYDVVINGLDNMSARKHVNRVVLSGATLSTSEDGHEGGRAVATFMPSIIESGTMGYNGQVQPIIPLQSECYDCRPKPSDVKTFAVCTIHARPTTMVHCVHFAKELYTAMFSLESQATDDSEQEDAPASEKGGDSKNKSSNELSYSAPFSWLAMRSLVKRTTAPAGEGENKDDEEDEAVLRQHAMSFVQLLFVERVQRQREQLELANHQNQQSSSLTTTTTTAAVVSIPRPLPSELNPSQQHHPHPLAAPTDPDLLSSLTGYVSDLVNALIQLWRRASPQPFQKEDDRIVQFLTGAANLRAYTFAISPLISLESVRQIAGNIVPAIASANAVIAASAVAQAVQIVTRDDTVVRRIDARLPPGSGLVGAGEPSAGGEKPPTPPAAAALVSMTFLRKAPQQIRRRLTLLLPLEATPPTAGGSVKPTFVRDLLLLHTTTLPKPNPDCLVCAISRQEQKRTLTVTVNVSLHTLRTFVNTILKSALSLVQPSVYDEETGNALYEEEEFEGLAGRALATLLWPEHIAVDVMSHVGGAPTATQTTVTAETSVAEVPHHGLPANLTTSSNKKRSRSPEHAAEDSIAETVARSNNNNGVVGDALLIPPPPPPPCRKLIVSDLMQNIEWLVTIVHDHETATDVAEFALNGHWCAAVEERRGK